MQASKKAILPLWLSTMISTAFVIAGLFVTLFVVLTVREVMSRPLNPFLGETQSPVAEAAAEVADISLIELDQDSAIPPIVEDGGNINSLPTLTPFPTSTSIPDTNRQTILVMGMDRRPGEPFISRTDSMMLLSFDPDSNTAAILSIPRDLYVVIPGHGRDRINTAFVYGAQGNNPAGGAALAMQTVEFNLGVPIDHYMAVDFSAVINGVDAIGGIDIYVPKTINDPTFPDMNYGYDPLYIAAGFQTMDGITALKYARTRHADNDLNRAARQQDVLLAVRDKVLGLSTVDKLRLADDVYNQVVNGIFTDMSFDQLVALATGASQIPEENIQNAVLDYGFVTSYTTPNGAQVLILINDVASPLIRQLFYNE